MGMALSVAVGRRNGSAGYVVLGGLVVVAIGAVFSLAVPQDISLLGNSQIASRTSPGLVDLVAAVATGFAGALALSRRDVAAYSAEVRRAAEEWLVSTPGATVTGVDFTSPTDVHVYVRQPVGALSFSSRKARTRSTPAC